MDTMVFFFNTTCFMGQVWVVPATGTVFGSTGTVWENLTCGLPVLNTTQVPATINFLIKNLTKVIIDSGSDITIISQKSLSEMQTPIKPRQGQQVNLVQVTGNASISGYVNIDLYFYTLDGPVKINVKAYVVKGMNTPLILGNDFADQYSISVICQEGSCLMEGQSVFTADTVVAQGLGHIIGSCCIQKCLLMI